MVDEDSEFCVALTTTERIEEADRLAEALVAGNMAACVQIAAITSHYVWNGKAVKSAEYLLLIKSRRSLYPEIEKFIQREHSYEVPELILLPVENGLADYLAWMRDQTRQDQDMR